ncbi:MAG: ABC transporter permease [Myxococcaceae bacterium]
MIGKIRVLFRIAFRNLFSSWINLIIGLLMLGGTVLVVVGGSLVESVLDAMSRSIVGSIGGHVQVYSAEAKGDLELFGGMGGEDADIGVIPRFDVLERAIKTVPNVAEVVPMGIRGAFLSSGNTIDITLSRLRAAVRSVKEGDASEATQKEVESLKAHVRQILGVLQKDVQKLTETISKDPFDPLEREALERASSDAFWQGFDADPYGGLEFLENKIAGQIPDGDLVYLRYVGTDLQRFQRTFDRMKLVDGSFVPPGQRGFLFAKFSYEEYFKLKNARRLDKLKEGVENGKTIATDTEMQRWVRENQAQTREIVLQLDPLKTQSAVSRLQDFLRSKEPELAKLLTEFFGTTDTNLRERYAFFYRELAPLLELYRVRIGDPLTVSTVSRGGYLKSVNVKIYGTFDFKGLEKSPLGGFSNLMDLMTFRDLYGFPSAAEVEELKSLKQQSGVPDIDRQSAEAALFGEEARTVMQTKAQSINEADLLADNVQVSRKQREALLERVYSQKEIDEGVALNAAVLLKNPKLLPETLPAIEKAGEAAGVKLKVVSGIQAAGIFGQFVTLARVGLSVVVGIIFLVILVILNNAVMMATLARVKEIGTLRAIGAQRGFVLAMVCIETLVLGLAFGALGLGLGAALVSWIHHTGIAARTDEMYFFFSGPVLRPIVSVGTLIPALTAVFGVSFLSTLYPAVVATRVSPLEAMQSDE